MGQPPFGTGKPSLRNDASWGVIQPIHQLYFGGIWYMPPPPFEKVVPSSPWRRRV